MIQFFIKYEHNDNEQFQISKKMKISNENIQLSRELTYRPSILYA